MMSQLLTEFGKEKHTALLQHILTLTRTLFYNINFKFKRRNTMATRNIVTEGDSILTKNAIM